MSGTRDHRSRGQASPYVGGMPFRWADSNRFFGRDSESETLRSLWLESRLVVVYGMGGVGKTSLVQAGVLPLMAEAAGIDLLPPVRLDTASHTGHDAAEVLYSYPSLHALLQVWDTADNDVPENSLAGLFASHSRRQYGDRQPEGILAAIDQFEKIFIQPEGESEVFLGELASALDAVPALRILLVADDEVIDQIRAQTVKLGIQRATYYQVDQLSREGALEAITRPLEWAGHSLGSGAAEKLIEKVMVADSGDPSQFLDGTVDPLLLQIIASEFWSCAAWDHGKITAEEVDDLLDADKAFRHFYDSAVARAHANSDQSETAIRGWVEETFIDRNGQPRFARRGRALTRGMPAAVIDALVEVHFLFVDQRSAGEWCGIRYIGLVRAILGVNHLWRSVAGEDALKYIPDLTTPEVLYEAARDALTEGDMATAQSFAGLAIERYRKSGDERSIGHALLLRGDIACSRGDLGSAEESFQGALTRFTALQDRNLTARTLSALGEVQMLAGDYRKAAEFQQLAIDQVPTYVGAMVGLGYARWFSGSPADAEAWFSQALTWDSKSAAALVGRGQVRAEMHESAAALRDIDRALEIGLSAYDEVDALSARGLALAGLDRWDEAERALAVARIREPGRARTLLRSARVSAMSGRLEKASAELAGAMDAQPSLSPWEETSSRRLQAKLRAEAEKAS
jgi:tetratricopeptide (TPR) repeat protein/GTPase SAR1 family protein